MKLLFRHIKNSVRRSPAQSLVLLLTVLLSAVIFSFVFEMFYSVREERAFYDRGSYGSADIAVTAGEGETRFLTESALGQTAARFAAVGGYFVLPSYDEEGAVLGAAADLYTVGGIFDFYFTQYAQVDSVTVQSAAFVSEDFASSRGLSLGSTFSLRLLGVEKEYVVRGVNRYPLCGKFDVLVHAEGALGALASVSPAFAAFDAQNLPYNSLFLRLSEGEDVAAAVEELRALPSLQGYAVESCAVSETRERFNDMLMDIFLTAVLVFASVIACVLVFFSLNIIASRRAAETRSFALAGTPPGKLFASFCIETAVYVVCGTLLGFAVSSAVLRAVGGWVFTYAAPRLTWKGALICAAAELATGAAAVLSYRLASARKLRPERADRRPLITAAAAAALAAAAVCAFALPVRLRYCASVLGLVAFLSLLLFGVPLLVGKCARLLSRLGERGGSRGGVLFSYAAKNVSRVPELLNVCRILSILLSVVAVLLACFGYSQKQIDLSLNFFRCDYVVMQADESAAARIAAEQGTQACAEAYLGQAMFSDGKSMLALSLQDVSFVSEAPPRPEGDGIVLPREVAALYGFALGDPVPLEIAGVRCEFVLSGYSGGPDYIAFINAEHFGLAENILLVRAEPDAGEDYLAAITEQVALSGALVQSGLSLLRSQYLFAELFLRVMGLFTFGTVAITALGAFNLVGVSYARRRKEMNSFRLAGMTGKDVARMVACEAAVLCAFVLALAAAGGALLCVLLDCGMRSFGYRLF